eukprot:GEMP01060931.1.p1 GENE.GEMP01060931.1~~GEMP01060931.1.p1  ORF type:complete len:318 (+),score=91.28 GEMP01060931.1:304-1257(+)
MIRVVGGGVSGLTTAVLLLEKGYDVEVFAKSRGMAPYTALFELPPFLTGGSQAQMDDWARATRKELQKFKLERRDFVAETRHVRLSRKKLPPHPNMGEMIDYKEGHAAFADIRLRPDHPYTDAMSFTTFVIDSNKFLDYLTQRIYGLGGKIVKKDVENLGDLAHTCDVVVNCKGMGARKEDPRVFPTYGLILLSQLPTLHAAVNDDDTGAYAIHFPGHRIELGGVKVPRRYDRTVDPNYVNWVQDTCKDFLVEDVVVDDYWTGLRPSREGGPRVEKEGNIVHCYGFGGSGFSMCYGYAEDAVKLVESLVKPRHKGKL